MNNNILKIILECCVCILIFILQISLILYLFSLALKIISTAGEFFIS